MDERRILVTGPEASTTDIEFLEHLGHTVTVCHGPERAPCPILSGAPCARADAADGIIFELDLDRGPHRAILGHYRAGHSGISPIGVATTPERGLRYSSLLAGLRVWTTTPRITDLDDFAALVESVDEPPDPDASP